MNLNDASEEQLKEALQQKVRERLTAQHSKLLAHIDALLELTEHSRTSCSGDDPGNYTSDPKRYRHRCAKCQLLYIKREGRNDGFVARVELDYEPVLE